MDLVPFLFLHKRRVSVCLLLHPHTSGDISSLHPLLLPSITILIRNYRHCLPHFLCKISLLSLIILIILPKAKQRSIRFHHFFLLLSSLNIRCFHSFYFYVALLLKLFIKCLCQPIFVNLIFGFRIVIIKHTF